MTLDGALRDQDLRTTWLRGQEYRQLCEHSRPRLWASPPREAGEHVSSLQNIFPLQNSTDLLPCVLDVPCWETDLRYSGDIAELLAPVFEKNDRTPEAEPAL